MMAIFIIIMVTGYGISMALSFHGGPLWLRVVSTICVLIGACGTCYYNNLLMKRIEYLEKERR